jgi:hypothetical protein
MTEYAYGHPINDKAALAEWMKYPSVDAMDADHDELHERICRAFGVPSFSLAKARGHKLTAIGEDVAACEEAAVLHVQRWLQWLKS